MEKKLTNYLNYTGGLVSGLCIIHCLLLPFLLLAAPIYLQGIGEEWIHKVMLVLAIVVSAPILIWQGNDQTKYIGIFGILTLIVGFFMPTEVLEKVVTTIGSSALIVGHVIRHTKCQSCAEERPLEQV